MKPYIHSMLSVKKYGGTWEDYIDIHDYLDASKAHVPDMRHRALLHNSFGAYLAEAQFGTVRENSEGRVYSVRDICEEHIIQDMGRIPTVQDYLDGMPIYEWLGGLRKKVTLIPLVD